MRKTLFFIAITLVFSCSNNKTLVEKTISPKEDVELMKLFNLMQGSFNSAEQAKLDSSYYNISLHMYPIWKEKDELYLYVEQALTTMQNKPYRQRVYKVARVDHNTFRSDIYKIENDSLWIGKWTTPASFNTISEDDLILRNGCEVLLTKTAEGHYTGSTGYKTCESTMRGATYATSEVEIIKGKIISWDRGFDAEGNHKWGAEKAGYIFNKVERVYRQIKPTR